MVTKFGQLIITKIIKTNAARCHILYLKCTKFDAGWGTAPNSTGELTDKDKIKDETAFI